MNDPNVQSVDLKIEGEFVEVDYSEIERKLNEHYQSRDLVEVLAELRKAAPELVELKHIMYAAAYTPPELMNSLWNRTANYLSMAAPDREDLKKIFSGESK